MDKIHVAVVDDNEVDRYIVKRKLAKLDEFAGVTEAISGEEFLNENYCEESGYSGKGPPLLVLMDINMPGLDGFETVDKIHNKMESGLGPDSVVVMMFTSSDSRMDRQRSQALDIVKGYICKPLDDDDIATIKSIFKEQVLKKSPA